jgi:HYR domain-containing protein
MKFRLPTRLATVAACLLAAFAATARAGTLQLDAIFNVEFTQGTCPAGSPDTDYCYPATGAPVLRGLGRTSMQFLIVEDRSDPNPDCAHATIASLPIVVAGKGEIDLVAKSAGCQPFADPQLLAYTVTGGSGAYAGATGSGTIRFRSHTEGAPRTISIGLEGTLDVPGLTFDTKAPVFSGVRNRVVKTASRRGARARFSVKATDAVDGPVPVTCAPRSGSRFKIGKTRVTCAAADGSGNESHTGFTITVKRRLR